MKKDFIELHQADGSPCLVNINQIATVRASNFELLELGSTHISFISGWGIDVKEDQETVLAKINQ